MVNRPDSAAVPGGDTVQMLKTRAALQELGIDVDVSCEMAPASRGYDLAHLFNLQRPRETLCQVESCRQHGTPTALSSIIYDFWRVRLETSRHWLAARRALTPFSRAPRWERGETVRPILAPFCWVEANWLAPCSKTWRRQRRILTLVDMVLPNSDGEARFLKRHFGLRLGGRIAKVPNAIDPGWAEFDASRRMTESPHSGPPASRAGSQPPVPADCVLQVGRIEPLKNQLATIRAMAANRIPLVFVGDAPEVSRDYERRCRELAQRRGNVTFISRVGHDDLRSIYARARVHVLPSFGETTGLVSLEAALMGCNIVTTNQAPTREYFGPWAWYCFPASISSIRCAIQAAYDAPRRPELKERILANFTWREAAVQTLAAYELVLQRRAGGLLRP